MHKFVRYLVNWVAGMKLIFILLLIVILLTGTMITKVLSAIAMIFSIGTFYWRLYPLIKGLDKNVQITPKGYSKTLGVMIGAFIAFFLLVLVTHFVF